MAADLNLRALQIICICLLLVGGSLNDCDKLSSADYGRADVWASTLQGQEKLMEYGDGLQAFDALQDDNITLHIAFTKHENSTIDLHMVILLDQDEEYIGLPSLTLCYADEPTCNLTYAFTVDNNTQIPHIAQGLRRTGSCAISTKFSINVKTAVEQLQWDVFSYQYSADNDTVEVIAEAVGYPRPTEYRLTTASGDVLYEIRSDKAAFVVTLNGSTNLTISADNRYNNPIYKRFLLDVGAPNHTTPVCVSEAAEEETGSTRGNWVVPVAASAGSILMVAIIAFVVTILLKSAKTKSRLSPKLTTETDGLHHQITSGHGLLALQNSESVSGDQFLEVT